MAKFDWYQATIINYSSAEKALWFANDLAKYFDLSEVVPAKPQMGFTDSVQLLRGSTKLVQIFWGGNDGIHFRASSDESEILAAWLKMNRDRDLMNWFKATRIDSAIDIELQGEFDRITGKLLEYANNRKPKPLKISMAGDWHNGQGRTLYIGSRQSQVYLRIYEKGFETAHKLGAEVSRPHWVRIEAEIKPQKDFKVTASTLSPDECFAVSWLPEALQAIGLSVEEKIDVSSERITDFERQKYYFLKQWSPFMAKWFKQSGCFDPMIEEIAKSLEDKNLI